MYLDSSEFARIASITRLGVADAMSSHNTWVLGGGIGIRRIIHSLSNVSRLSNMGVAKQSFSNFDKPRPHQTSVLLLRTDQNIMSP